MNRVTRMGLQLHCLYWDVQDDTTYEQGYRWADMVLTQGFTSPKFEDTKTILVPETAERVLLCKKTPPELSNQMDECKCRIIKKLFFSWCKLCLSPICLSPLHSVLPNKCNQKGGLGRMPVTKSNGSLQILQARWTGSLQERRLKDIRCTLPTSSLCLPPSVCFFWDCRSTDITFPDFFHFQRVSTYTDNNAVEGTILQWSNLWFWLHQNIQGCRELAVSDGEEEKGTKFIKIWHHTSLHRLQGQCETILWHLKSSLPLCSLFSPPLIFMSCFSPAVLSFGAFPRCLHFEPNSINLSGKLQMFWVNYVNHREIKLQKAWSSLFIS